MFKKLLIGGLAWLSLNAAATPIAGLWQTIDDKTGKARAVIEISEHNEQYAGKIIKVFKQKGDKGICQKCQGELKNKPVLGLTILKNMTKNGEDLYEGGEILDPKSGKVYRCKMTHLNNETLQVRGFIGMPLLGRSQTWHRLTSEKV